MYVYHSIPAFEPDYLLEQRNTLNSGCKNSCINLNYDCTKLWRSSEVVEFLEKFYLRIRCGKYLEITPSVNFFKVNLKK